MNISMLISGNLTGFGRFYTSPAAKELLGKDKIDLDNHNYLTFLENGEKAYSITFAKRFIALSLYTNILDSFRRPGKLVVTLLLPRDYTIVANGGSPKGAAYALLNRVCDRFFEKNFLDGMIIQNPTVLGQDYYSEILEGYSLAPKESRKINLDPAPMKKVAYVRALETEVPLYLDAPYRRSYGEGGYNLVFFSSKAPAGSNCIEEEAEEVVLYRVRVLNTGAVLPEPVRLTSPVYRLPHQLGDKPFQITGTYKDVLDHLLEPRITGRIAPNEVIEIQYNFEKETKELRFTFRDKDTRTVVNLNDVLPALIFADGSRQFISSESFMFRGAEIYGGSKKIVAESKDYVVCQSSENLDLSRYRDNQEVTIMVQRCFTVPLQFEAPYNKKKTIVFRNKLTREEHRIEVADRGEIRLPGRIDHWEVFPSSEFYDFVPNASLNDSGKGFYYFPESQIKARSQNKQKVNVTAVQKQGSIINFGNNSSEAVSSVGKPKPKFKWQKLVLPVSLLLFVVVLGSVLFGGGDDEENPKPRPIYNEVDDSGQGPLLCYIMYCDNSTSEEGIDYIKKTSKQSNRSSKSRNTPDFFVYDNFSFDLFCDNKEIRKGDDYELEVMERDTLCHKFTLNNSDLKSIKIRVSFKAPEDQKLLLWEEEIKEEKLKDNESITIKLPLKRSELRKIHDLFNKTEFKEEKEKEDFSTFVQQLNLPENSRYDLLDKVARTLTKPKSENEPIPTDPVNNDTSQPDISTLSRVDFEFSDLVKFKGDILKQEIPDENVTVRQRVDDLKVLEKCINGGYPGYEDEIAYAGETLIKRLSPAQREMVNNTYKIVGKNTGTTSPGNYKSIKDFDNRVAAAYSD